MTWVDDVLRTEPLARRAPSVLNTQPVVLRRGENFVEVGWDPARTLSVLDPRHDQLWLALGAFVEAMLIAGAAAGLGVRVEPALDEARHRFALLHSGPVVRPPFDADDLRMRFFHSWRIAQRRELARLVQVDYTREMAFIATAPDGYPVHGWVVLPEGDGPHPVLLMIHGGPFAGYTPAFFDEAQVYAEAGYAVVMCNPRGSAGYGRDHGRAIQGDFGNLDSADVLAFLDHAVTTVPGLDGARVGIMGGSYGGYLTAWIIAHDHRWAGAIVERGYLDPASFVGASDIGWFFPAQYNGTKAEQDAQSPMLLAGDVTTPTLVIHSELDLRCPLSQGLQYYTVLKQAGVDAELLVFPGENHELSRSGTPWHRRQRFEAILDWWARHLPV